MAEKKPEEEVEKLGKIDETNYETVKFADEDARRMAQNYVAVVQRLNEQAPFLSAAEKREGADTVIEQITKQRNTVEMNKLQKAKTKDGSNGEQASKKQINYLKSLAEKDETNIKVPENPTKIQASNLIDKANKQLPATSNQLSKMDEVGLGYSADINKHEASQKLDNFFEEKNND